MKKVLFVATVVKGHIDVFHIPFLKMFKENGWETTVVSRNNYENPIDCQIPYCDNFIDIPFERNPLHFNNIKSYFELKKIIDVQKFDLIHCHTPVGGVVTRLAARKKRKEHITKVIYTAHGFHFFNGAPIKNWCFYYPVEKMLSMYTDTLITINKEDFEIAKNKFYSKDIQLVPGVGIDMDKFKKDSIQRNIINNKNKDKDKDKEFILTCIGELNKNKNQEFLIRVVQSLVNEMPNVKLLLVGEGSERDNLELLCRRLQIEDNVYFLGYRKDIPEILRNTDLLFSVSKREGLPVNVMEAMASGKPIIASNCRGNKDLVENNVNGFLINNYNVDDCVEKTIEILTNNELFNKFSNNSRDIIKSFNRETINSKMKDIYNIN